MSFPEGKHFVSRDGDVLGRFSAEEITESLREERLRPHDLIYNEETGKWSPISLSLDDTSASTEQDAPPERTDASAITHSVTPEPTDYESLPRGQRAGFVNMLTGLGFPNWALGCLSALLLIIFALPIILGGFLVLYRPAGPELAAKIGPKILEDMHARPDLARASMQKVVLTHKGGRKYDGYVEGALNGQLVQLPLNVRYSPRGSKWQVGEPSTPAGSATTPAPWVLTSQPTFKAERPAAEPTKKSTESLARNIYMAPDPATAMDAARALLLGTWEEDPAAQGVRHGRLRCVFNRFDQVKTYFREPESGHWGEGVYRSWEIVTIQPAGSDRAYYAVQLDGPLEPLVIDWDGTLRIMELSVTLRKVE